MIDLQNENSWTWEPLRPGNNAKIAVQEDTEKKEEMDAVSKTKFLFLHVVE